MQAILNKKAMANGVAVQFLEYVCIQDERRTIDMENLLEGPCFYSPFHGEIEPAPVTVVAVRNLTQSKAVRRFLPGSAYPLTDKQG